MLESSESAGSTQPWFIAPPHCAAVANKPTKTDMELLVAGVLDDATGRRRGYHPFASLWI
eukprot:scaffold5386_cov170-Skeletonema_menzelii.AAC.1